jgi:hypothetical protein
VSKYKQTLQHCFERHALPRGLQDRLLKVNISARFVFVFHDITAIPMVMKAARKRTA